MSKYDELVDKLKEIFELKDTAELDFGIYRILHARADKIKDFLENRLQEKVREQLSGNAAAQVESLKMELQKARANAESLGIENVDATPKVQELKAKLAQFGNHDQTENDVYSHLLTFFGRYYEKGDFISKRRYKGNTYAIPYSGEEVKLYWANADQYYIKSSEHFSNYSFTLANGKKVHFIMVHAALPSDNQKDNEAEHRYVLWNPADAPIIDATGDEDQEAQACYPDKVVEMKEGELCIYFRYARLAKGSKQNQLFDDTEKTVLATLTGNADMLADFSELSASFKTAAGTMKTNLRRHLDAYIARNTMDYFIHKDLKGFLSRELDFYIKNEIMNLDDIQDSATTDQLERSLKLIQVFRSIAKDLIEFMAQLEDFQKRLWLKQKFVTQCEYCITMDRVPEDLRSIVLSNQEQMQEWEHLGTSQTSTSGVDARMVDTKFFNEDFKAALLQRIGNLDADCGGVLIHAENAAALRLLQCKLQDAVDAIYIDPPYNTGNDNDFLYKDNYQHSSWISCMHERAELGKHLMTPPATIWVSTDDGEYANIKALFDIVYGDPNFVADVIWNGRKSVSNDALLSVSTNHTTVYSRNKKVLDSHKADFKLEEDGEGFSNPDNDPRGPWTLDPLDAPNIRENLSYAIEHPITHRQFYPPKGRHWSCEEEETKQLMKEGRILFGRSGKGRPLYKRFLSEAQAKGKVAKTLWDDVSTTSEATKMLSAFFGDTLSQNIINKIKPKPVELVAKIATLNTKVKGMVLDYFAGSGTTAHAIINLNRRDGGARTYVLVEMGDHFDSVLLPRLKKVVYSPQWKDGEAIANEKGISHSFKYMSLESYEDALNNLQLEQPGEVPSLLHDEYLLRYMLEFESKGSFINTDSFRKPFDYKLQVTIDSSGAMEERKVDLPETFNYLIGLTVTGYDRHIDKGYILITGTLPNGDRTLVIWRDVDKLDSQQLNNLLDKLGIHAGDSEYKCIYVNGDHAIPSRKLGGDDMVPALKVRLIEEDFLRLMFNEEA